MTGDGPTRGAIAARLDAVAARHGVSRGAVLALAEALARGGGRMAQFSHPELGGMGQWSGGMLQIGAMSDRALKARVAALIADLAGAAPAESLAPGRDAGREAGPWPPELGRPSASGAQGGMRYAYFAEARRLAVVEDGRVTLYDTGQHRISGASQSQCGARRLAFASDHGEVDLRALRVVGAEALTRS